MRKKGAYMRGTCPIVRKLFLKQSEHITQKENCFRSESNTLDRKKIIFEAKRTRQSVSKLFSKRSEHIRQKENYFRIEANTLDRKKIIFEAKRTPSILKGHGNEPVFPTFLHKLVRHGSLTLLFEPFRFQGEGRKGRQEEEGEEEKKDFLTYLILY